MSDQPHMWTVQETVVNFDTQTFSGLSEHEAQARLVQYGPNRLGEVKQETLWQVFLEEVREPMILLLLIIGVLYSVWGKLPDAFTILVVILTLIGVEVFNEYRAKKAIAGLSKFAEPVASVRRNRQDLQIPVEYIVPGDIILVRAGQHIPADARLFQGYSLAVDEASLTGESVPVEKDAEITLPEQTALAERRNMLFAGTTITRGRGAAIVVATGMQTELGHVARLVRAVKTPRTPLQQSMRDLTRWLVWFALGFSALIPALGVLLSGQPVQQMLLTGFTLAFAVIPEELPIIITMVLALGAYRLSRQQAIIKRLQAVETLGSVTVIATDKTGTLTENRIEVEQLSPQAHEHLLLELGVLCNSATSQEATFTSDPLEGALLRKAQAEGLDVEAVRRTASPRGEFPFDNTRKRMSVVFGQGEMQRVVVKGAPEAVLAKCARLLLEGIERPLEERGQQAIMKMVDQMAAEGLRVIALAEKTVPGDRLSQDGAESNLTFIGLIGMADPPRPGVKAAIAACRTAGIRPVMITGDHPLTARAVAAQVGLDGSTPLLTGKELDTLSDEQLKEAAGQISLYARTTPEHKLRIVRILRERGERIAVTGDGINDAPALAAADIGVAMGETGTDVAREVAAMVLANDNFTTIVNAIKEGRVLFANLTKGVRYYLACKVALVAATLLPVLLRVPVPFAPIQIILMELFMDLAASATFVSEPAEADLMRYPPRDPHENFMNRRMVTSIFRSAAGLFAAVSVAYLLTWYTTGDLARSQTVAFVTWLLGHLLLAINLRSEHEPLFRLGLFSNRLMIIWGLATVIFLLFATLTPGVQVILKTVPLRAEDWLLTLIVSFAGTCWLEVRKLLSWKGLRSVNHL